MKIGFPRVTALGCIVLLASCDERPLASPDRGGVEAAQSTTGGPFAFVSFELGAARGTTCPGSSGCTNGARSSSSRPLNTKWTR